MPLPVGIPLSLEIIDITDPADPRVDDFRNLRVADRRPDRPGGRGLVIAEGAPTVARMLGSRFTPHALLGVEGRLSGLAQSRPDVDGPAVPAYRVSSEVLAAIVGFPVSRGVLAVADRPAPLSPATVIGSAQTIVVLEGVTDHENIGSIFRNAAGLGVDGVLLGRGCADPLYRRAVRVSMGNLFRVPFAACEDWPGDLLRLRDKGFRVVALTPGPEALPLADAVAGPRVAFLVGAEGPGLTDAAMAAADLRAVIPMSRDTDSLNVATAAAIACYARMAARS